jgi:chromosomal replication initiator protein
VAAITGADFARQWDTPVLDDGIDDHDVRDDRSSSNANEGRTPKPRTAAWNLIALFVLDNVDDLADKPAAQRELCAALDQITATVGRAIITSRRNPARDVQLSPALASRLCAGLVVSLAKLGKPGRAAVVAEIALARGLSLSVESIERIAASSASTVPELAGLIVQLDMTARAEQHAVDEAFVRGHVVASEVAPLTVAAIAQQTAKHFGAKLAELRGPARRKEVVAARCVAIYLARELTGESLQSIGRYFGNRDHATIAYNIEKVAAELAASEPNTAQAIARIREAVQANT